MLSIVKLIDIQFSAHISIKQDMSYTVAIWTEKDEIRLYIISTMRCWSYMMLVES
jgi:hypothetical protein